MFFETILILSIILSNSSIICIKKATFSWLYLLKIPRKGRGGSTKWKKFRITKIKVWAFGWNNKGDLCTISLIHRSWDRPCFCCQSNAEIYCYSYCYITNNMAYSHNWYAIRNTQESWDENRQSIAKIPKNQKFWNIFCTLYDVQ